jgi:hypothetical protein
MSSVYFLLHILHLIAAYEDIVVYIGITTTTTTITTINCK